LQRVQAALAAAPAALEVVDKAALLEAEEKRDAAEALRDEVIAELTRLEGALGQAQEERQRRALTRKSPGQAKRPRSPPPAPTKPGASRWRRRKESARRPKQRSPRRKGNAKTPSAASPSSWRR